MLYLLLFESFLIFQYVQPIFCDSFDTLQKENLVDIILCKIPTGFMESLH